MPRLFRGLSRERSKWETAAERAREAEVADPREMLELVTTLPRKTQ
jgi:hypothetical protein